MSSPLSAVPSAKEKATAFLRIAEQFKLGDLPTEMSHPDTTNLSTLSLTDLPSAIRLLRQVELQALQALHSEVASLRELQGEILATWLRGGRVFFCGCGATGRLSVALETLWRERNPDRADQVRSFIAGGDYAMVRSIENFEDHPEYGARQLHDLGFESRDLLIASSEGGETPFVIGAVEEASRIASHRPWFLFCNPVDVLTARLERSRNVIGNPRVRSLSLETGPMAVAGSTRLQASTVLMLAAGSALFSSKGEDPLKLVDEFRVALEKANLEDLAPLIEREADIYHAGEHCCHETLDYGVTVLTDTTERSPTFSLIPFENRLDAKTDENAVRPSWTYLSIRGAASVTEAWLGILKRAPRPLDWAEVSGRFDDEVLRGFDFDESGKTRRTRELMPARMFLYQIDRANGGIRFSLENLRIEIPTPAHLLTEHLILKCALNISSTLTMGRLGRFSGNRMVFVKATNNKLIDRSIRCITALLRDRRIEPPSYEAIARELFDVLETISVDEPAVLRTVERLST